MQFLSNSHAISKPFSRQRSPTVAFGKLPTIAKKWAIVANNRAIIANNWAMLPTVGLAIVASGIALKLLRNCLGIAYARGGADPPPGVLVSLREPTQTSFFFSPAGPYKLIGKRV